MYRKVILSKSSFWIKKLAADSIQASKLGKRKEKPEKEEKRVRRFGWKLCKGSGSARAFHVRVLEPDLGRTSFLFACLLGVKIHDEGGGRREEGETGTSAEK